ncbi:serine/threonine-protein kinase [Amycolatopsis saalfeldensis]|uniref:non-specific serine/threonine protein kinase n=1 Tax=Amycolatopsis saalfeldensis TaxID=394193 RepID=A0A1H8YI88_9PSEU|nr:serine/threonine-protein kinase [Amycolatopsis saalfeldensis]SEP51879.1 Serine/threonine protein kinase [Amycolatopsis saalfeldensis]
MVAGRYRLRSVLGAGSMGTVWSAYDEFLHRPVAVKEMKLPPGVPAAQADELRERTLREARAIAVLSHPNVIILHDVARDNNEPFVVMELLPSRSLAHILRDHGPLNVEQAAAVGIAVAAALEAAHAAGITHRDVKPGNVLVAGDGRIKLTDFGIARNVSEATMTRTGIMLGSPAYIAPEVASGGAVTPNADLWGLGATLFAAAQGAPPYDADGDPLETVGKVVNGKVPKPNPGPLAAVIGALMKKEPEKRISLREVRHRLYPLQGKTALDLFGPELFRTPDGKKTSAHLDATDTQVIKTVTPDAEAEPKAAASAELAADPGPLPFLRGSSGASGSFGAGSSGSGPGSGTSGMASLGAALSGLGAPGTGSPGVYGPGASGGGAYGPGASGTAAQPPAAVPAPSGPARRGVAASVVLVLAAVVLFLVAGGGGFALARVVSGQSLLPPEGVPAGTQSPPVSTQPQAPLKLAPQKGDASDTANPTPDSLYTVSVPDGWKRFVAGRTSQLGPSTVVQYVSPDGRQSLRLERFPRYFASHEINDYVKNLPLTYSPDSFTIAKEPTATADGVDLTYRNVEKATSGRQQEPTPVTRVTFASLRQAGNNLWVLSLTAPSEQEDTAVNTFGQIEPTLTLSSS